MKIIKANQHKLNGILLLSLYFTYKIIGNMKRRMQQSPDFPRMHKSVLAGFESRVHFLSASMLTVFI